MQGGKNTRAAEKKKQNRNQELEKKKKHLCVSLRHRKRQLLRVDGRIRSGASGFLRVPALSVLSGAHSWLVTPLWMNHRGLTASTHILPDLCSHRLQL